MGKDRLNVPRTPEEIIQEFERNSANPGAATYEVRDLPEGGRVVVKVKPQGEETYIDVPSS